MEYISDYVNGVGAPEFEFDEIDPRDELTQRVFILREEIRSLPPTYQAVVADEFGISIAGVREGVSSVVEELRSQHKHRALTRVRRKMGEWWSPGYSALRECFVESEFAAQSFANFHVDKYNEDQLKYDDEQPVIPVQTGPIEVLQERRIFTLFGDSGVLIRKMLVRVLEGVKQIVLTGYSPNQGAVLPIRRNVTDRIIRISRPIKCGKDETTAASAMIDVSKKVGRIPFWISAIFYYDNGFPVGCEQQSAGVVAELSPCLKADLAVVIPGRTLSDNFEVLRNGKRDVTASPIIHNRIVQSRIYNLARGDVGQLRFRRK